MRDLLNSPMSVGLEIYGPPEEDFAAIDSHQMNTSGDSKREYEKTFSTELPTCNHQDGVSKGRLMRRMRKKKRAFHHKY